MFSKFTINCIAYRYALAILYFQTPFKWDFKNWKLVPSIYYCIKNSYLTIPNGLFFVLCHIIHAYTKISSDEETLDAYDLARIIIQFGEISLVITVTLLMLHVLLRQDEIIYLTNQLISHNDEIRNLRKSKNMPNDPEFKKKMRQTDILAILLTSLSMVIAPMIFVCSFCRLEATRYIFLDWLEFDLKLKVAHIPFMVVMILAFHSYANVVFYIGSAAILYHNLATSILAGIIPERVVYKVGKGRCRVVTPTWGILDDTEVIHFYRIQQIYNIVLHSFMASVLLSFHQITLLSTAVVMIFVGIQYQDIILEFGYLAYVVVGVFLFAAFVLVYLESEFCGTLVRISKDFKSLGLKLTTGSMLFNKFAQSCGTFHMPYAYPFYTINKNTLLEFAEQVVDYTVDLLLW